MQKQLRVGVVGTGSAGAQHAIVLANLPGVTVVAGADPKNGIELFDEGKQDSWYIEGSKWYADESDMLEEEQIDALVLAPDPLSIGSTIKASVLAQFDERPTLWERPVGFKPEHTAPVQSIERGTTFSVVTFNRFGVIEQLRQALQIGDVVLGDIVSFDAFMSLSIPPFERKPWRWDQLSCQLPIHLLDHIYDTLMYLGLPQIESVHGVAKYEYLWGRTIDRSWAINLRLGNGAVGSINAVQYPQNKEHLMPLKRLVIIGSEGVIKVSPGEAVFTNNAGEETKFTQSEMVSNNEFLKKAKDELVRFLIEREGYVDTSATHAAAESLVLCDWHWVQNTIGTQGHEKLSPLGCLGDSCNCLKIGNAIVESAAKNVEVKVAF
ncbi:Gfo/Idh/MocA family protein [Ferrimonas balearica]|uniref:Gfo/Idh/MocA family protein n=1 Tax=Ferrimonas balearica TaxID=44012 RepID=UPI001F1F9A01|nr:hypothetical protein [Ferrimonas balearica]MBY6094934.1 hypothetical protein [Ferrimonas balearica]